MTTDNKAMTPANAHNTRKNGIITDGTVITENVMTNSTATDVTGVKEDAMTSSITADVPMASARDRTTVGEQIITMKNISFNAKGFKQSHVYVSKLLSNCDIVGVSETWLRPGELSSIKDIMMKSPHLYTTADEDITVYAKSSMVNIDPGYCGRPYGGMAMICRRKHNLTYDEIDIQSDRIIGVKVCNNDNIVQIVLCLYMPYFNGDNTQTELYIEVLDILQTIIDQYGATCPIHILGDINVQLPASDILNKSWFKVKGFNKHSRIMYDFIKDNNMYVVDFSFSQSVPYTYYCHTAAKYTWIDHCLNTVHDDLDQFPNTEKFGSVCHERFIPETIMRG